MRCEANKSLAFGIIAFCDIVLRISTYTYFNRPICHLYDTSKRRGYTLATKKISNWTANRVDPDDLAIIMVRLIWICVIWKKKFVLIYWDDGTYVIMDLNLFFNMLSFFLLMRQFLLQVLTLCILVKYSADDISKYVSYFSQRIGFDHHENMPM